jgi:hypothetical protein
MTAFSGMAMNSVRGRALSARTLRQGRGFGATRRRRGYGQGQRVAATPQAPVTQRVYVESRLSC